MQTGIFDNVGPNNLKIILIRGICDFFNEKIYVQVTYYGAILIMRRAI